MAETPSKRPREETHVEVCEKDHQKRHKSYNHILSILEDEEDETNQDLSSFLTTLQQELSCDFTISPPLPGPTTTTEAGTDNHPISSTTSDHSPDIDEEGERVMRHLLEASDDELGIPHKVGDGGDTEINGGDHSFALCDGDMWEFEDETANYYALLQSELFL